MKRKYRIFFGTVLTVILMLVTPCINANQIDKTEEKRKEIGTKSNKDFHVLLIHLHQDDDYITIPYSIWVVGYTAINTFPNIGWLTRKHFAFSVVDTNEVTIKIQGHPLEWTKPFSEEFDLSEYGTFVRFKATTSDNKIEIVE